MGVVRLSPNENFVDTDSTAAMSSTAHLIELIDNSSNLTIERVSTRMYTAQGAMRRPLSTEGCSQILKTDAKNNYVEGSMHVIVSVTPDNADSRPRLRKNW